MSELDYFLSLSKRKQRQIVITHIKSRLGEDTEIDEDLIYAMEQFLLDDLEEKERLHKLEKTGWY